MLAFHPRLRLSSLGLVLIVAAGGCTLDQAGLSSGRRDAGQFDGSVDAGQDSGADARTGTDGGPGGHKDSSALDDDASKPVDGKDSSMADLDAAADGGVDAGVDAYIPPPPPPPTRLLPHLSGGSVGRSINYRLYHSVGAPRVAGATVPQGMSSSANYRLNSGLSAALP